MTGLPVPSPATTKDTNTMTETTVYASKGGTAFHNTRNCRAREAGQGLWDTDDWPGYAIQPMTIPAAMGAGKLPCLVCMPDLGANWFRTPCEDDFGHEPFGPYDGAMVCRRCYVTVIREWVDAYDNPRHRRVRDVVLWPCTSAVVLGLVPRPTAA